MTPNAKLLNAVSEWSRLVAGCGAAELRITLADGMVVSLTPPEEGDEETPRSPVSTAGWVLTDFAVRYAGKPVPIPRRSCLAVLRVLVDAGGGPVTAAELAAEAWPDYEVDQRTVNNTVSLLRRSLRESLALGDTDPILSEGGSYRLAERLLS